jgi:hypothetical protein
MQRKKIERERERVVVVRVEERRIKARLGTCRL